MACPQARCAVDNLSPTHASGGAASALSAHYPGTLLRTPNVQHAFVGIQLLQVLLCKVVLALVLGAASLT
jgi:hypothetical protein